MPIELARPLAGPLNDLKLFRFRRNSGHGRTCCWLNPVANDPKSDMKAESTEPSYRDQLIDHALVIALPVLCG